MPSCRGTKRDGTPCTLPANHANGYCWAHSPEQAEQRRRAASRAGKSKPNKELASIKQQLQKLTDDVLEGRADRADGATAGQLLNTLLQCLEVERRWRELGEIEARLEALETQTTLATLRSRHGRA
jgi:hypothetical protein